MKLESKLVLVPTPLDEELPLEPVARKILEEVCLNEQSLLLVEDHKVARQRWIRWGLPREAIERFRLYHEHNQEKDAAELVQIIQSGKTAFLISDGGLPAFCDPGQELVRRCHEAKIRVSSTPFPNSVALAVALSGMNHHQFLFAGFLPTQSQERKSELDRIADQRLTTVILDTPYRLMALIEDLGSSRLKKRQFFLATDLGSEQERGFYGNFEGLKVFSETLHKPEFVMVISG